MVILWIMSAIGVLVVAPLVVVLATRVVRPASECERYAHDILDHGLGTTAALDAVPALLDTREATSRLARNATAYVSALRSRV